MTSPVIKSRIDAGLEAIATHPFIRRANNGTCDSDEIERWLFCAGRESRVFPRVLEGMSAWISSSALKRVLLENLADENGNGDPSEAHFRHYIGLISKLNIPQEDFETYREGPGVLAALQVAEYVQTCRNLGKALGYLLINEAMTPVVYSAVQKCLKLQQRCPETDFFSLHISTDDHHVAMLYSALETLDEETAVDVVDGVGLGERAMGLLLDEAHGCFVPLR